MIELTPHLAAHLPAVDTFDAVLRLGGEEFRRQKNRRTVRCEIGGRTYFLKIHGRTALSELAKNLARLRLPTMSAQPERQAIARLTTLGVPTLTCAGFGHRGVWINSESFIVTDALEGYIHLDAAARQWRTLPRAVRFRCTKRMIAELATIARTLHGHGVNHRDFYLCHFMLPDRDLCCLKPHETLGLHVIDLHRAQFRARTPERWVVKDLAGLLFSSLDEGVTGPDCVRFLRVYWGEEWRERFLARRRFLRSIIRKARRVYRGDFGRWPRLPAGLASF